MNTIAILAVILLAAYGIVRLGRKFHARNLKQMANTASQPGTGESLNGYKTFSAGTASAWPTFAAAYTNAVQPPGRFALVKLTSAGVVDISSGATDNCIGIAQDSPDADGDPVTVRLINSPGTARMVAGAAITAGALVQSNGDGAIKTAVSTGFVIGRALNAAGAAGDIVEVMLYTTAVALA